MARPDLQFKRILDDIESVRKALAEDTKRVGESLRTHGVVPVVNLAPPPPINFFCGRLSELSILADYFSTSHGMRIAAIIGSSGMGKTALARKFLQDINEVNKPPYAEDRIELEGILYFSARTSGISLERIFFDCARLLAQENALRDVWNSRISVREKAKHLLKEMQDGLYIILLDNFEELLDSQGKIKDADIQEFLYALCEMKNRSSLLITSNEPLALPGEIEEFYYPLNLDSGLNLQSSKELLRQLDSDNRLGLRDAPDAILNKILAKVRGAPRALELLVSLINHKPPMRPEEIPSLIPEGPYDKVIKELSKKTFSQLSDKEKCILEAISVFSRPVPVVALEFLLFLFLPNLDISELTRTLGVTHTITYEKINQEVDRFWVSLHPMDQGYIYKRIPTDESQGYNAKALEKRAANYYAKLRLERPWYRIAQLEPQLLEFAHRMRAQDYKGALFVIDSIDYSMQNHHKYLASLMALGLGNRAIDMRAQLRGKLVDRNLEAQNLTSMGWLCRRMGRKEEAEACLKGSVSISPPDAPSFVYALSELGYFLTDNANLHDEAEKNLSHALSLSKQSGDVYLEAHCLLGLAFVDFQRGRNVSSLNLATDARNLFHKVENPYREIDCLVRMGMIYRKQLNYEAAIETALEGLKIAKRANLKDWEGELNSGLGFHYRGLGKYDQAIEAHKEALRLFTGPTGMKREEAVQQSYLGNLYSDVGQLDEAEKAYGKAERIAENVVLNRELSWIWGTEGILLKKKGKYQEALDLQKKGLNKIQDLHPDSSIIRHTDLADTYLAIGQYEQAQNQLIQALTISARLLKQPLPPDTGFPEAYLQAPYQEDALPQEMQSPGDHQRRGVILARTYLHSGDFESALLVISHVRKKDVIPHRHATAALQGLVLFRLGRIEEAKSLFLNALQYAGENIGKTRSLYDAYYTRGLVLTGLGMMAANEQCQLLNKAAEAYKSARNICREKGVVDDALQLFDELQSSAICEGKSLISAIRNVLAGDH